MNECMFHRRPRLPVDCWSCGGEGCSDHDCGDDTCCCLNPEPNVSCDICGGSGTLTLCPECAPDSFEA